MTRAGLVFNDAIETSRTLQFVLTPGGMAQFFCTSRAVENY